MAPALAYYDLAPWLGISSGPPTVVTAGQPFDMTVEVANSDGGLDAGFVGSVTISLSNNPGGDAMGGTLTEPVVGGYASFTGLTLTHAAAGCTILAFSGGPAAATTAPFTVAPAAPAQLAVEPSQSSGGPAGLIVTVLDGYGNVVTSFTGGVTVQWGSDASPTGSKHRPRLSATASGGIAAFAHLKPPAGSRSRVVQVAADGLTAAAVLPRSSPASLRSASPLARAGHAHPAVEAAPHPARPARSHRHHTAG